MNFHHVSVLLEQSVNALNIKEKGIYVDATLGGGGHSYEICKYLRQDGHLIGIDQDLNAINAAKSKLKEFEHKVTFVHENFKNIKQVLCELDISAIDGAVMDLGVSSYQLDEGERGFSYQHDAPLDMRMNQNDVVNAYNIVNEYSEQQLSKVLFEYGEEKWAKRIAQFIVHEREKAPIRTTSELVNIIKSAIPAAARREGSHPAKRTFQAIRIEVNGELAILENAVRDFVSVLRTGGRLAVITFHSLEDRIVKQTFHSLSSGCECPPGFPVCICGKKPIVKVITRKPMVPSKDELDKNPRARSSKLRVIEKI